MEIYNHIIEPKLDVYKYFPGNNPCFLDIETTGLSRKYNQIYLIGLVYYNKEKSNWNLVQLFANSLDKEKEILESLNDILLNFDFIISYNGDSFDIPFIKYRMKYYKIENKIEKINSFDIYRKIKNNDSYLGFENLKLKTVEKNLGIYRNDKYSGKDCINFYFEYINTQDINLKKNILKHNYDDLYYLLEIIKIFDILKDIKTLNIILKGNKTSIQILDMIVNGDVLNINCKTTPINTNIIHYGKNFNLKVQNKDSLIIDLNIGKGLITPTKKALYIQKSKLPIDSNIKDLSQYMVPNDLILLKVEKKWIMENIKNIINQLVLNVIE